MKYCLVGSQLLRGAPFYPHSSSGGFRAANLGYRMTANGRYVALHITDIMYTVELYALWFFEVVKVAWLLALRVGKR